MQKSELDKLIRILRADNFQVIGPTVEDQAITYREIEGESDLPRGYRDQQRPGKYSLVHDDAGQYFFEFNVGPHSWKQFLFPPDAVVATAARVSGEWKFEDSVPSDSDRPLAFLGVRACELAAIGVQDRVFLHAPYVDPIYKHRRESLFIVAVNCTVAAETCFCTSMGTGPKCRTESRDQHAGFDLALTELESGFLVEVASSAGSQLAKQLTTVPASVAQRREAAKLQERAVEQIEKRMDTTELKELLFANLDHPHWDDVAERCLSCTNCTMVCPTCFCSSVSEVSNLEGDQIERKRQWDSCFNVEFGYTAGGTVRNSRRSRFRQWLTHKLASWHDQFGSSGCVGCGRCITWCPVGIDLTEEVAAIRNSPSSARTLPVAKPDQTTVCAVRSPDE